MNQTVYPCVYEMFPSAYPIHIEYLCQHNDAPENLALITEAV